MYLVLLMLNLVIYLIDVVWCRKHNVFLSEINMNVLQVAQQSYQ